MRNLRTTAFLAAAIVAAIATTYHGAAQSSGTITGVVFNDVNGDGVRGPDEPGLRDRSVQYRYPNHGATSVRTGPDGTYRIEGPAPRDYTLTFEAELSTGLCVDPAIPAFSPLLLAGCFTFPLQWLPTTPESVQVALVAGEAVEVDFGAQAADVVYFNGKAIIEGDYPRRGTRVTAYHDGQECGTGEVHADPSPGEFDLQVLGARERPGCALPGDTVTFTLAGAPAKETFTWPATTPGGEFLTLTMINDYAWYWFETTEAPFPEDGTPVQALIDGGACGETVIQVPPFPDGSVHGVGFSKLLVPSIEVQARCGTTGATVSFLVGGIDSGTTLKWQPGVQQLGLGLPEPPAPPPTGMQADDGARTPVLLSLSVALALAALAAGSTAIAARRYMKRV